MSNLDRIDDFIKTGQLIEPISIQLDSVYFDINHTMRIISTNAFIFYVRVFVYRFINYFSKDKVHFVNARSDTKFNDITEIYYKTLSKEIQKNALLHYAVQKKDKFMIKFLLADKDFDLNAINSEGDTALYDACQKATTFEGLQILDLLLSNERLDVNQSNFHSANTVLHKLASNKEFCSSGLKSLLKAKKIDVNKKNKYMIPNKIEYVQETPLHVAIKNRNIKFIKILLEEANDIIDFLAQDYEGNTPLHSAIEKGHTDIVKLLLNHYDINQSNRYNYTPLYMAAKCGRKDIAEYLLTLDGIDVNKADLSTRSPLYIALDNEHIEIVELLLKEKEINVNLKCKIKILDYYLITTKRIEETPLHLALRKNNRKLVNLLLNHKDIDITVRNQQDRTPLSLLIFQADEKEVMEIFKKNKQLDVNHKDIFGQTYLHRAVIRGFLDLADYLLKNGCNLNEVDKEGQTPLLTAFKRAKSEMGLFLLKQEGVDVEKSNKKELTPLYYAYKLSRKKLLIELLKYSCIEEQEIQIMVQLSTERTLPILLKKTKKESLSSVEQRILDIDQILNSALLGKKQETQEMQAMLKEPN